MIAINNILSFRWIENEVDGNLTCKAIMAWSIIYFYVFNNPSEQNSHTLRKSQSPICLLGQLEQQWRVWITSPELAWKMIFLTSIEFIINIENLLDVFFFLNWTRYGSKEIDVARIFDCSEYFCVSPINLPRTVSSQFTKNCLKLGLRDCSGTLQSIEQKKVKPNIENIYTELVVYHKKLIEKMSLSHKQIYKHITVG